MSGGGVSGLASAIEGETPGIVPRSGSNVGSLASRFEKADAASSGPVAKVSAMASKFAKPSSPGMRRVPSGKSAPFKATPTKRAEDESGSAPAVAGLASRFEQKSEPARTVMRRVASENPSAEAEKPGLARVSSVAERFSGSSDRGAAPEGGSSFAAAQGAFLKKENDAKNAEPASRVKAVASVFGDTLTTATGVSPLKRAPAKPEKVQPRASENIVHEPAKSVSKVASVFENNEPAKKNADGEEEPSLKERFAGAAKVFGGTI